MRQILCAAAMSAAMVFSAQAFELESQAPVNGIGANLNIDLPGTGPQAGTVLERFADTDSKGKDGRLQVFGENLGGTYGLPNTIPGPANEVPSWFYSTPTFRAAR